jgi:hypothetical protein
MMFPSVVHTDLLTERMTTRMEWARETLGKVWTTDPNSSSAARPLRMQVVMDSNWWMWNLLLAASPAVIIALYCEFVAKPQMIEQLQQQAQQGDDQI